MTEQPVSLADIPLMRRTLGHGASIRGRTLHGGRKTRLTLHPAEPGSGVRFWCAVPHQRGTEIPAFWTHAVDSIYCTALRSDSGIEIRTVEHLLFALFACGIDDVLIELDGDEVPILDGSAAPLFDLLRDAGTVGSDCPRRFIELVRPVTLEIGRTWLTLEPCDGFEIDLSLPLRIGLQRWVGKGDFDTLSREIAPARTFGQIRRALPAMILSRFGGPRILRGASMGCALVYHGNRVLNRGGLREADDAVALEQTERGREPLARLLVRHELGERLRAVAAGEDRCQGGMADHGLPARRLAVEYILVDIRQRTQLQEAFIIVVAARHPTAFCHARFHSGNPTKRIIQPEGAVVMPVITNEHIRTGRLR